MPLVLGPRPSSPRSFSCSTTLDLRIPRFLADLHVVDHRLRSGRPLATRLPRLQESRRRVDSHPPHPRPHRDPHSFPRRRRSSHLVTDRKAGKNSRASWPWGRPPPSALLPAPRARRRPTLWRPQSPWQCRPSKSLLLSPSSCTSSPAAKPTKSTPAS